MAYRRTEVRVFLNGEEITSDVHSITVLHNPDELVMATVELYVNDITKDSDGNFVYWLGHEERVIEDDHCPMKDHGCIDKAPHLHSRRQLEDAGVYCE